MPSTSGPQWICQYCNRSFKSKRGLGVHRHSQHPEQDNEAIELPGKKIRWKNEELLLMASFEAKAIQEGVQFVNQYLLEKVPDRTIESIKGVRRRADYKRMVKEACNRSSTLLAIDSPAITPRPHTRSAAASVPLAEEPPLPSNIHITAPPEDEDARIALQQTIDLVTESREGRCEAQTLTSIARSALQGRNIDSELMSWLSIAIPDIGRRTQNKPSRAAIRKNNPPKKETRKTRRRREYARIQTLWRQNQSKAAHNILSGKNIEGRHGIKDLLPFWSQLFGQPSKKYTPPDGLSHPEVPDPTLCQAWRPISYHEIETIQISVSSSSGLDNITARQWKAVPVLVRLLFYNLILYIGHFPKKLLTTRTIFIPKSDEPASAADYRPISVASVVVRQLHKILATRLQALPILDKRQRGFIKTDGTAQNTVILDALIHTSRSELRELHLAVLDISKAFDSLSHDALKSLVRCRGFHPGFISYVENLYQDSNTKLQAMGATSGEIPVKKGVRQGDPLSPILFNLAIDKVLASIPSEVGFVLGKSKISALAFADDLIIVAGSKWGLQTALDKAVEEAAAMGLQFNVGKSSTLSYVPAGKSKKIKVVTQSNFTINDQHLPAASVLTKWKYLGVEYSAKDGTVSFEGEFAEALNNISKAPLKPQQRLKILSTYLLPKIYHSTVLGTVTTGRLLALDRQVRKAVRLWLRLPHDTSEGYFHAAVKDGGLGIPSLMMLIPAMTLQRINRLASVDYQPTRDAISTNRIQRKLRWATNALQKLHLDPEHPTTEARNRIWAQKLHMSTDGEELVESSASSLSTAWVNNTVGIPGRDYVQYHHVRVNSLPARVRITRGERRKHRDIKCRAGCRSTETAAHVIQNCWRTHGGRLERHNAISRSLAKFLQAADWAVEKEPHIPTSEGLRKPDIIARKDDKAVIIDAQVVSGSIPTSKSHKLKVDKYDIDEIKNWVGTRLNVDPRKVKTTSCTITWRGIWSEESDRDLTSLGLKRQDLASLTTRALQGSHTNWTKFNQITSRTPGRTRSAQGTGFSNSQDPG